MKETLLFLLLLVLAGCQSQTPQNANSQGNGSKEKAVAEIVNSINALEKQGREMEQLRGKDDLESMNKCAVAMKKHSETVAGLQSKIKTLPRVYRVYLEPALKELEVCASCSTGSLGACDNVKKSLEDMQKAVEEENKK